MNDLSDKKWLCIELPATEYREAWRLQSDLVAARKDKSIGTDVVLLLEHPPVFTVGNNSGMNNLTVSKKSLEKAGIPLIRVERGGDITFHGPGQLVMYPVIDLRAARLSVLDHIEKLEEVMIRTARDWGIMAQRNLANRGVWVGKNKLGSVVIAIRRGISFHGMALNVNLSLEPFGWINPCGLQEIAMTSMEQELSHRVALDWVLVAVRRLVDGGVWVGKNKLGSVGIAIRRGISFHGMALNVNLSLEPFGWINPCGLQEIAMTSMEQELSHRVAMNQVREAVKRHLEAVFGVELVMTSLSELQCLQEKELRVAGCGLNEKLQGKLSLHNRSLCHIS